MEWSGGLLPEMLSELFVKFRISHKEIEFGHFGQAIESGESRFPGFRAADGNEEEKPRSVQLQNIIGKQRLPSWLV
jgi:hypothetical protein